MNYIRFFISRGGRWLKAHKKKCGIFFLIVIFFVLLKFPYNEAVLYLVGKMEEQTNAAFKFDYENFYFSPLSSQVVFQGAQVQIRGMEGALKTRALSLYPSYRALLTLNKGVGGALKWSDSALNFVLRQKTLKTGKTGWLFQLSSKRFNLVHLREVFPLLRQASGHVEFHLEVSIDPSYEEAPSGFWNFKGKNLNTQALSYTFPGHIGTISLPAFQWKSTQSSGTIEKGQIRIKDTFVGEQGDPFQLKLRGLLLLDFKKTFSPTPLVSMRNYNMALNILASVDIKPKLYFLDIFLSSVESKTEGGSEYLALLRGSRSGLFNLSRIPKLPTLEELENPPSEDDEGF